MVCLDYLAVCGIIKLCVYTTCWKLKSLQPLHMVVCGMQETSTYERGTGRHYISLEMGKEHAKGTKKRW